MYSVGELTRFHLCGRCRLAVGHRMLPGHEFESRHRPASKVARKGETNTRRQYTPTPIAVLEELGLIND